MPAFYRTYRPSTFAEVIGQEHIVRTLENALKTGKLSHAYLFTGPRGTGKTTLARLLAKAANCQDRKGAEPCGKCENCKTIQNGRSMDLIEFDAATHTQVDKMREILEGVPTPPASGPYRIYIIDEAHMLSPGAWNAFLKTLEEPPAHAIFILATTALHKVPETIVSRCQRFDLSRFPVAKIIEKLELIAKSEKLKIQPEALRLIALSAEGGMRDAESLFTAVATLQESPITEEDAAAILGVTSHEKLEQFTRLLGGNDLPEALAYLRELSDRGENFSAFVPSLLRYLRVILLAAIDKKAATSDLESFTDEQRTSTLALAASFSPTEAVRIIELFSVAAEQLKNSSIPELPIEIATVKAMMDKIQDTRYKIQEPEKTAGPKSTEPKKSESKTEEKIQDTSDKKQGVQETRNKKQDSEKTEDTTTVIPSESASRGIPRSDEVTNKAEETTIETAQEDSKDTTPATFSFEDVKDRWRDIIREATKINASLTLALTNARPAKSEGNKITIAVRFPFHKDRLAEPKAQLTLVQAFDTILSARTKVAVVVAEPDEKPGNPLISQALAAFGGSVV
ncbi:MAG: DNA polymerase III subunit gamma/tau [Candidatus Moranbacteria bacterium]|nr:DNA polymerase III subunit gamma/tau [Candidatus Moranbacteria bacterium]